MLGQLDILSMLPVQHLVIYWVKLRRMDTFENKAMLSKGLMLSMSIRVDSKRKKLAFPGMEILSI